MGTAVPHNSIHSQSDDQRSTGDLQPAAAASATHRTTPQQITTKVACAVVQLLEAATCLTTTNSHQSQRRACTGRCGCRLECGCLFQQPLHTDAKQAQQHCVLVSTCPTHFMTCIPTWRNCRQGTYWLLLPAAAASLIVRRRAHHQPSGTILLVPNIR